MRKVGRGDRQRVDADFQNKLVDVVNERQTKLAGRSRSWSMRDPDVIDLKNDHTADVGRFGILKLDGPVIDPDDNEAEFTNRFAFSGIEPDDADTDNFCITTKPIKAGKIARNAGIVSGVTVVKVDIQNASDEFAFAKDGSITELESGVSGPARILWKESGTGIKWAIVRLGGVGKDVTGLFKTPSGGIGAATEVNATTFTPGSADCYKVDFDGTNMVVDTSETTTVYNSTPSAVRADAIIQAKIIDGEYFIDVEPCKDFP